MANKYFWIIALICSLSTVADAQAPSYVWVKHGSVVGNSQATGRRMVTDADGNTYVTGDFDGPSLTLGSITLTAPPANNGELWVAKYDPLGNILWAKQTDSCRSMGTGISLDNSGKVYLIGQYYFANPYTAQGHFGPYTFAAGNGNGFVAQLDAATGNVNWVKQGVGVGGSNTSQNSTIAAADSASVYVCGTFNGTVTWGGITYTSVGYYDAFLAKYDNAGHAIWVRTAGAAGQTGFNGLTTDNNGDIYVGGYYQSNLRIGTDTFTGSYKLMVAKYDAFGTFKWSRSCGGTSTTNGVSKMAHDSHNNIYVVGLFAVNNGTITWGGYSLTNTTGNYQTYLTKFDPQGNISWLKCPGSCFNTYTNPGIALDKLDNIYLTSAYYGSATFGSTTLSTIPNGNTDDFYVAKFDTSLTAIWAKSAGGDYVDESADVSTDAHGNVYVTGNSRSGNTDVVISYDTISLTVPSNQKYAFIGKIGTNNLIIPPVLASFVQGDSDICAGSTVGFIDQSQGTPTGWAWTFPGGTPPTSSSQNPTVTYNSAGTYDVVLVASNNTDADSAHKVGVITVHANPTPTLSASDTIFCASDSTQICIPAGYTSYSWSSGGSGNCIWTRQAGGYWATVTDANGCSAISSHQNVSVYPTGGLSLIVYGDTLTSFEDSCQWYLNDTLLPDANTCTIIARVSGYYAVRTTEANGCKTLSSKVYIAVTGIEEADGTNLLSVYPNPLSVGNWQLTVDNSLIGNKYEVYDAIGRLVFQSEISNLKSEIAFNASPGMYMLRVASEKMSVTRKLVKQ